ncbi:hypothetical protein [Chitinophaga sp. HK235]|uniref:hypothetical protein n=1 Tax=Chitinophaga sp. HK235 TaxID=2952571 RepID=UPI001BA9D3FD|nr:hypothetical protein [Chitinophaga sp. HK235]
MPTMKVTTVDLIARLFSLTAFAQKDTAAGLKDLQLKGNLLPPVKLMLGYVIG